MQNSSNHIASSLELCVDLKLSMQQSMPQRGETRRVDLTCVIPHEVYEAVEVAPKRRHYSTPIARQGEFTLYQRRDGSQWLHMRPQCVRTADAFRSTRKRTNTTHTQKGGQA